MADIDIPERKFTLDEVKEQSAILVVTSVDFVYERFAFNVKRDRIPSVAEDAVPDKFKLFSQEDIRDKGAKLIQDYVTWFKLSPRAEKNEVIPTISSSEKREEVYNEILNNPEEVSLTDVSTQHTLLRDKLHRSKLFRDSWLLHNEEMIIQFQGDSLQVTDKVWEEEMEEFSTQVRKVLDDLDIQRRVRETSRRQRRMRRLLRMAGLRPFPILDAPITGRPQPVLDRVRD